MDCYKRTMVFGGGEAKELTFLAYPIDFFEIIG